MSWLVAIAVVVCGVGVFFSLGVGFYQSAYSEEILAEFRTKNEDLRRELFGPNTPTESGAWHRVLSAEEHQIVAAGQGILRGLRQVALIEDERGRHWRVVVAHEKGKSPFIEAKELRAD